MIVDRTTLLAGAVLLVAGASQWPVVDEPAPQVAIYLAAAVLVAVVGLSERARNSRFVTGASGALFLAQGVYVYVSATTTVGVGVGLLYAAVGMAVVLYQSGVAPWGRPENA